MGSDRIKITTIEENPTSTSTLIPFQFFGLFVRVNNANHPEGQKATRGHQGTRHKNSKATA
jgi:hypothetical protein